MLQECNTCKKRLFKEICEKTGTTFVSDNISIKVRNLRSFWGKVEPTPQRWKHVQQFQREYCDLLLEMPQQRGYKNRKMGTLCSRTDRLRCLGNMVVPQQAYPIFKVIADYELKEETKK